LLPPSSRLSLISLLPELVEGYDPEPVEGYDPEPVEGYDPEPVEGYFVE